MRYRAVGSAITKERRDREMLPECGKCALPPPDPHGTDLSGGTSVSVQRHRKREMFSVKSFLCFLSLLKG